MADLVPYGALFPDQLTIYHLYCSLRSLTWKIRKFLALSQDSQPHLYRDQLQIETMHIKKSDDAWVSQEAISLHIYIHHDD